MAGKRWKFEQQKRKGFFFLTTFGFFVSLVWGQKRHVWKCYYGLNTNDKSNLQLLDILNICRVGSIAHFPFMQNNAFLICRLNRFFFITKTIWKYGNIIKQIQLLIILQFEKNMTFSNSQFSTETIERGTIDKRHSNVEQIYETITLWDRSEQLFWLAGHIQNQISHFGPAYVLFLMWLLHLTFLA